MTLLVFDHTGQVATELTALPNTLCLGRDQADLSDPARPALVSFKNTLHALSSTSLPTLPQIKPN